MICRRKSRPSVCGRKIHETGSRSFHTFVLYMISLRQKLHVFCMYIWSTIKIEVTYTDEILLLSQKIPYITYGLWLLNLERSIVLHCEFSYVKVVGHRV